MGGFFLPVGIYSVKDVLLGILLYLHMYFLYF